MASPDLGTKRLCAACNLKFYDLHRTPIVCPTCEAVFVLPVPAPSRPPRRSFAGPPAAMMPVPLVAEQGELQDDVVVNDVEMDKPDALVAEEDKLGDELEEKVGNDDDDASVPILIDMEDE
jgi:uncharacterized protein (TIGR02300 family)